MRVRSPGYGYHAWRGGKDPLLSSVSGACVATAVHHGARLVAHHFTVCDTKITKPSPNHISQRHSASPLLYSPNHISQCIALVLFCPLHSSRHVSTMLSEKWRALSTRRANCFLLILTNGGWSSEWLPCIGRLNPYVYVTYRRSGASQLSTGAAIMQHEREVNAYNFQLHPYPYMYATARVVYCAKRDNELIVHLRKMCQTARTNNCCAVYDEQRESTSHRRRKVEPDILLFWTEI